MKKHFYVNWRLKKHIASHNESNKFCHYFNNDKVCPFEEVGCKYKHAISDNCKYDKNCRFKLCQFKHTNKNETGKDTLTLVKDVVEEDHKKRMFSRDFKKMVEKRVLNARKKILAN